MIRGGFFIAVFLLINTSFAQQQPLFTQYYVNDMIINPAVSGSKPYNHLIIQTRKQWLGFEGAPLTSNISYHTPLNNRSAMGGYVMFDKASPNMQATIHLNYAYHIPLDYDHVNLSFGLGGKVMYYNLDFNREDLPPVQDPAFSTRSYDQVIGDASSGVYVYSRDFYIGFSASNILQSSFITPVSGSPYGNLGFRNYYGIGAYRFRIDSDWKVEPSFLIRKVQFQSNTIDLTARLLYLEDTWAGLTYRTNGTAVFSLGFGVDDMHIAYSYDYIFAGEIMQYTNGTHELAIIFSINRITTRRDVGILGY